MYAMVEVGRRHAGLAHRHADDAPPPAFQPLVLQQAARQGLGLEEQRRVRRDGHLAVHPGLLERALSAPLAHGDHFHMLQAVAHRTLHRGIVEGSGADGVEHHGNAFFLGNRHLAQIYPRLGVVQDAAPAEDQQVEPLDLGRDLCARKLAHRDRALDAVAALGVLGVAREHRDLDRQVLAQLRDDRLQDRLIAEVQAAIRAGDADFVEVFRWGHGRLDTCKKGTALSLSAHKT
jgi:hypothetical protein